MEPHKNLWTQFLSWKIGPLGLLINSDKNNKEELWMIGGDFNLPLFPLEKLGGLEDFLDSMMDLGGFFNSVGLIDIPLITPFS